MLRAVVFALAAVFALIRESRLFTHPDVSCILETYAALFPVFQIHEVIIMERSGNINPRRAWHTVSAAGAAHFLALLDYLFYGLSKDPVFFRETSLSRG